MPRHSVNILDPNLSIVVGKEVQRDIRTLEVDIVNCQEWASWERPNKVWNGRVAESFRGLKSCTIVGVCQHESPDEVIQILEHRRRRRGDVFVCLQCPYRLQSTSLFKWRKATQHRGRHRAGMTGEIVSILASFIRLPVDEAPAGGEETMQLWIWMEWPARSQANLWMVRAHTQLVQVPEMRGTPPNY